MSHCKFSWVWDQWKVEGVWEPFCRKIGELYTSWDLKWTAAAITIHLKFTRKALSRENFKMRCNFGKKCRFSWQNQPLTTTAIFSNQLFVYIIFFSFTVIAGTFASFSTTKINMWSKCVTVSFCFETFLRLVSCRWSLSFYVWVLCFHIHIKTRHKKSKQTSKKLWLHFLTDVLLL